MPANPTVVFVPGGWHRPSCYEKVIAILEKKGIKCISVTLPSTQDNPQATFKDDIDAARDAITSETTNGRDVIVVAHSYGGMVGNSAIKDLTAPKTMSSTSYSKKGYARALVLIASGFTITGVAFMDPLLGLPLPFFRVNKDTGYAELTANVRELFYHDISDDEAEYWVSQLTFQSLKALYEGGEHAYAGWQDVPVFYIGTAEDKGLPVMAQRLQVGMARTLGAVVYHVEMPSSHSPMLSMPEDVASIILDSTDILHRPQKPNPATYTLQQTSKSKGCQVPVVRLGAPATWIKFGLPYFTGSVLGWCFAEVNFFRKIWRKT